MVAETALRELGRPTLVELLELTALIGQKDRPRFSRMATRWLLRYVEARGDATLDDAQFAAAALQQLGGRRHAHAMAALRDIAETVSPPPAPKQPGSTRRSCGSPDRATQQDTKQKEGRRPFLGDVP